VTSGGLAAIALMPAAFWSQLFRSLRDILSFTFVLSIGAYVSDGFR
jgi:hypothetical protein